MSKNNVTITGLTVFYTVEVEYKVNGEERRPFDVLSEERATPTLEYLLLEDINIEEIRQMLREELE